MRRLARASSAGSTDGTGSSRGRLRRAFAAPAAIGSLALVMALALVPAASAAPWGFEKVTPNDKGGGSVASVDTFQTSPDGESLLYTSVLPFDSAPTESVPLYVRYLGTRGADAWSSRALDPPYKLKPESEGVTYNVMGVVRASQDLSHVLVASTYALTPGATEDGGNLYVRDTHTGELTLVATHPNPLFSLAFNGSQGATGANYLSNDGREVIFTSAYPLLPGVPTGNVTQVTVVYGWTPEGGLKALTVMPAAEGGEIVVGATAVWDESGARSQMPTTGGLDHVYFYKYSENGFEGVYVRSGDTTEAVSVSRLPGADSTPVSGQIKAVSDGGTYMLFETTENSPLTTGTPVGSGSSRYLYRYDVVNDELTYVGTSGSSPFRVIQMTQDGQTIAFQSTAPMVGKGTSNRQNIYVWRNGVLQFVSTPDSGSTAASSAKFMRVLSSNGRYLAYTDSSKSLAEKFGFNNTSAACPTASGAPGLCDQMYLFDADGASEQLKCVSCRSDGQPPSGKAGDTQTGNSGYARMNAYQKQSVATDGTVYFSTPDPLLPAEDNNGLEDVYAYRGGNLTLVSRATQGTRARFLDATPDGKTVFISTNDPISPTDNDRAVDIYMTREGAGFPYTPPDVTPSCMSVDACHSGASPRLGGASPVTSSFQGQGNEIPHSRKGDRVRVVVPTAARGNTATLRIKVPAKGKVIVTGSQVNRATKFAARAGTVAVKVTLDGRGRRALHNSGQVRQKVTVTFRPSDGKSSSRVVRVVYGSQASKKGGR